MQNNGGDDLSVDSDGNFSFSQELQSGTDFFVTVAAQPVGQVCIIGNGAGTVDNADVSTVTLECFSVFSVGGVVNGLVGQVTLQNQGADDLTLTENGSFTFPRLMFDGSEYFVSVLQQPDGQECVVVGGAGNLSGANVTSVEVNCALAGPHLSLSSASIKTLTFGWTEIPDAVEYRLLERVTDTTDFEEIAVMAAGTDTFSIEAFLPDKAGASYFLQACDMTQCADSDLVEAQSALTSAIGYLKASNAGVDDRFGGREDVIETRQGRGIALSADGQTLVVGAPREASGATGINGDQLDESQPDAGAAYVFSKIGPGEWQQTHYIKASNTGAGDRFGSDVALSDDGSTLVVSALREASNATTIDGDQTNDAEPGSGAAYVFVRDGAGGWLQQAYLKPSNTEEQGSFPALFGSSLALSADGNTSSCGGVGRRRDLEPGAPGSGVVFIAPDAGAAYVFTRDSQRAIGAEQDRLALFSPFSEYGTSLDLSADGNLTCRLVLHVKIAVVLASAEPGTTDLAESGAVDIYVRDAAGAWTFETFIKASNTGFLDLFGTAVALSGDGMTLAVGAVGEGSGASGINGDQADDSSRNSGAVYVFDREGPSWVQRAYVKPSNTTLSQLFGADLALTVDGTRLVVGSPLEISNATGIDGDQTNSSASGAGAAYLFESASSGGWQQIRYIKASNTGQFTGENDNFGVALDLSNDGSVLAVGASGEDSSSQGIGGDQTNNDTADSGAVYLY